MRDRASRHWLVREHSAGGIFSIEKVGDEIQNGIGDLTTWAPKQGSDFFLPPEPNAVPALTKMSTWVTTQPNYAPAAVSMFMQVADYHVFAQALAGGHVPAAAP